MQPITLALSILVPRLTVLFWTPARLCNSIRYKHPRPRPLAPDFLHFLSLFLPMTNRPVIGDEEFEMLFE